MKQRQLSIEELDASTIKATPSPSMELLIEEANKASTKKIEVDKLDHNSS